MPSLGTADARGERLLANRTGFHELLYAFSGHLLQLVLSGHEMYRHPWCATRDDITTFVC